MTKGGLDLREQICYAPQGMGRWRAAMRLVGVGWYIGLCIALGLLAGHWLDNKLNTNLLWLAGLILGIAVAFYGVYRMLLPSIGNRRDKENS